MAKISIDLTKIAQVLPAAMPEIAAKLAANGMAMPSWLGYLGMGAGLLNQVITTGDDGPNMSGFDIGPEGHGLSNYWRTHSQWTDEAVFLASEDVLTDSVPTEFQQSANKVMELIKYTSGVLSDGKPPTKEQYRRSVDSILRDATSSSVRRYGDMLMFTLKLRHGRNA